ncbi:hypothetical protein DDT91_05650 [Algoriphagus sp. AK58]|nr:hypothetical protein [Algoriphagus sp. AK58]
MALFNREVKPFSFSLFVTLLPTLHSTLKLQIICELAHCKQVCFGHLPVKATSKGELFQHSFAHKRLCGNSFCFSNLFFYFHTLRQ